MPDRESFLAAIIANPNDDLPRLVFADWVDEQNNGYSPRAEFIRVQCELSKHKAKECRLSGHDPKCCNCDLHEKRWPLIQQERAAWDGVKDQFASEIEPWFKLVVGPKTYRTRNHDFSDWSVQAVIDRGFVDEVKCSVGEWMGVGRCPYCAGVGSYVFNGDNPELREVEKCELCCGFGFQQSIGPLVVKLHPLTTVRFNDVRIHGYGGSMNLPFPVFSNRTFAVELGYGDVIPDEIFTRLAKGKWGNTDQSVREYDTQQEAKDDISAAAIAWAKWWNTQAKEIVHIVTNPVS